MNIQKTFALALAAMVVCGCVLAQAPPPATGTEAQRRAEAEKKAQEAEKRAQEAKKQAQWAAQEAEEKAKAAEEKAREIEMKIQVMQSRPRLGVLVNTDADAKADPVGALLSGVTPGGPAEEAGVKAGDIVVKFNGKTLAGPNPDAEEGESGPGLKLLQMAKNLKADEKVTLEVRRGGDTKSFTFKPRTLGPQTWVIRENDIPSLEGLKNFEKLKEIRNLHIEIPDVPELLMLHGGDFDMELVSLNPELGEYFGTTEGLLVVRAPKDDALKLRGGDVLLKIGDRVPKTPSQAMRILHSYEPGEEVNIEVLRKQKHQKITVKMPDSKDDLKWTDEEDGPVPLPDRKSMRFFYSDEDAPSPPAPPAPPAAPSGRA